MVRSSMRYLNQSCEPQIWSLLWASKTCPHCFHQWTRPSVPRKWSSRCSLVEACVTDEPNRRPSMERGAEAPILTPKTWAFSNSTPRCSQALLERHLIVLSLENCTTKTALTTKHQTLAVSCREICPCKLKQAGIFSSVPLKRSLVWIKAVVICSRVRTSQSGPAGTLSRLSILTSRHQPTQHWIHSLLRVKVRLERDLHLREMTRYRSSM